MRWQTIGVELRVLAVLVLREHFEPFRAWRRFLLQFELLLGAFGLFSCASFLQLGFTLSQNRIFVGKLPNRWLVLLPVLQLDAQVGQHVVSDFIAELEHDFGTLVGPALNLVSEVREGIHDRRDGVLNIASRS